MNFNLPMRPVCTNNQFNHGSPHHSEGKLHHCKTYTSARFNALEIILRKLTTELEEKPPKVAYGYW